MDTSQKTLDKSWRGGQSRQHLSQRTKRHDGTSLSAEMKGSLEVGGITFRVMGASLVLFRSMTPLTL